jgi:uncharacterized protein (DUF1330 family)
MAAYVVVHVREVKDHEGLENYLLKVLPPILQKFGGEFIMRGRPVETLKASTPDPEMTRMMLGAIRFENAEQARRWFNAEEYRQPKALLERSAVFNMFLFEGLYGL